MNSIVFCPNRIRTLVAMAAYSFHWLIIIIIMTYNGKKWKLAVFSLSLHLFRFLAHLSRRLTRWAYRIGLEPASVCPCVCPLTISNMNISKTRGPIATKFYLKHHWGGGKPALGFGPGRIRTLVSMATDSSHRVIVGKTASPPFLGCFWSDPFHTCR